MSNQTPPIARGTLDQLSNVLGRLTENLGGNRNQLETNLSKPVGLEDLASALEPLLGCKLLNMALQLKGQKDPWPIYATQTQPFGKADAQGNQVITALKMTFLFSHPHLQQSVQWVIIGVDEHKCGVSFHGATLNTGSDEHNTLIDDGPAQSLSDIEAGLGDEMRDIAAGLILAAAGALAHEVLPPKGQRVQKQLMAIVSGGGATNAGNEDLPLSEKMTARVQEILRFLESVYGLKENDLIILFESTLRGLVQNNESLTLADLRESALSHEALADMVSHAAANIDEANLLAFEIPLKDDNGKTLDSLILAFSTDNITVELKSKNLSIAAKATQPNIFKAKGVATVASSSGNVSAKQAKQNREMIAGALRTLMPSAQGDSANKIREALLTINGFS